MLGESIGTYFRITTNGTMRTYRSNLMHSRGRLNDGMEKVMTHRQFNSYAEDPAKASKAFQLRRSIWRVQDQISNVQTLINYNQSAWSALDSICDGDLENRGLNGFTSALAGISDTAGSGRTALGQDMLAQADAIVMNMNVSYGDKFVFAGNDRLNVPFEWDDGGELLYRGVDVNCGPDPAEFMKDDGNGNQVLDKIAYEAAKEADPDCEKLRKYTSEKGYVDIGLGMKENDEGDFLAATGYDSLHHGVDYIGWGKDDDGDPKNIAVLMKQLGGILERCDRESGDWASSADEEDALRLSEKLLDRIRDVSEQHVRLTAETTFLDNTELNLKQNNDLLDEQREETEGIDPADAITQMAWANYCYQAALKIGQSVLSQSLLDYMR